MVGLVRARSLRTGLLALLPGARLFAAPGPATPDAAAAPSPGAGEAGAARPTLLLHGSVQRLLTGDQFHVVLPSEVRAALARFPAHWRVVGAGSTSCLGRTGELMPDGTAGDVHFWWADPQSPSQARVADITAAEGKGGVGFPLLGLAVGDPATAVTLTLDASTDMHLWLAARLADAGLRLAGLQVHGELSHVRTTVTYNIPPMGVDPSQNFANPNVFRFGEYGPATWTLNGLYSADAAVQALINTPGNPVHLHGYQPATMLGGHIVSATATRVTATVWPLVELVERPLHPADPSAFPAGVVLSGGRWACCLPPDAAGSLATEAR